MWIGRTARRHRPPATGGEFWRHGAVGHVDPDAARALAADATARQDGPAMMAAGWALAVANGLHDEELVLLSDGFAAWRRAPGYQPTLGRRYLEQLLGELTAGPAVSEAPPDVSAIEDAQSATVNAAARCWIVGELLELGVEPVMERWLYGLVTRCALARVPVDSMHWAMGYAARHDLPAPWR